MTGRRLWRARCSSTPRPDPFCVWGGYGPLILNLDGTERTYQPLGDRGMLSMMSGSLGTADQGAELNLNATDPDALALIDVAPVRARATILAELVFDASGTDLLAVNVVLRGRMDRVLRDDTAATAQGGRAGSVLKAIVLGAARALRRGRVRMRTDADQRLLVGTDGAFKKVGHAAEITLNLGGSRAQSAGSAVSGGTGGAGGGFIGDTLNLAVQRALQ